MNGRKKRWRVERKRRNRRKMKGEWKEVRGDREGKRKEGINNENEEGKTDGGSG